MSCPDRIMVEINNNTNKYDGRKKEIANIIKINFAKAHQESEMWNLQMKNSITNSIHVEPNINVGNKFKLMAEIVNEFNSIYSEKGSFVSSYFEGQLNTTYNCVAKILDRFHAIQIEGVEISIASSKDLDYLLVIMKNIIVELNRLYEKSNVMHMDPNRQKNEIERLSREMEKAAQLDAIQKRQKESVYNYERSKLEEVKARNEANNRMIYNKLDRNVSEDVSIVNEGMYEQDSEDESYELSDEEERVEDKFKEMWSMDKEYCHNIRKMVNNMCSQITSSNPRHTIDRLQHLLNFLRGNSVALVGSDNAKHINLKQHPDAIELFWYLFYRAVLIQAETQFAMNIDTTVVFASFAVGLFGAFPTRLNGLFELIFYHYPVLTGGHASMTDLDHYVMALKGVARLVAAVAVAQPPPNFRRSDIFTASHLWSLLAALEGAQVQESLSAEGLNGLLEMGGNCMWRLYGLQFEKMLHSLKRKYQSLPGISEIALVLMVDDGITKRRFESEGCLSEMYWQ